MKKIKKNDEVIVRIGKDKGKRGKVLKILSSTLILVEGVNRIKKTQKSNPKLGVQGGIIEIDQPINISNIGLYNSETKRADKVSILLQDSNIKTRVFKKTNQIIEI